MTKPVIETMTPARALSLAIMCVESAIVDLGPIPPENRPSLDDPVVELRLACDRLRALRQNVAQPQEVST